MPFDYYSLPYCQPVSVKLEGENVGEALAGDRIENSVYQLDMKKDTKCEVLCTVTLSKDDRASFVRAIDDEYRVHWLLDNLPVGIRSKSHTGEDVFERGFPVGFHTGKKGDPSSKHYLNNHVHIIVQYMDDDLLEGETAQDMTSKVIGFRVEPSSISHHDKTAAAGAHMEDCQKASNGVWGQESSFQSVDSVGESVVFTYDVVWEATDIPWTNRWDAYMTADAGNDRVHWFSITNSIMVVLFLTVMMSSISFLL